MILDTELGAEIFELGIVKPFPIIRYQGSRDSEPANKVTNLFLDDRS